MVGYKLASTWGDYPEYEVKECTPMKTILVKKEVPPGEHPPYKEMIVAAICDMKEEKGSSRIAILRYILANYKVGSNIRKVNHFLKDAITVDLKRRFFVRTKGTGSGLFSLKTETPPKSDTAVTRKPAKKKAKAKRRGRRYRVNTVVKKTAANWAKR